MRLKQLMLATLVSLLACGSAAAATVDVSGVKLEDTVTLAGTNLQLNGAGVRYKAVFKVYVAGLYLGKKAATPEEAYSTPGAKRIAITMLRDIDPNELGKLFTKGITDNAPRNELSKLLPGLAKTGEVFSSLKKLSAGESFTIDWIPGTGAFFIVNGTPAPGVVKEPEFFNAVLGIWLGANPPDWKLKDALLGKAP